MRIVVTALLALAALQAPAPDTEIFLAPFSSAGGAVKIGQPVNITNNAGYDNQPSFTPDGSAILFTSVRGGRKPDPANSAAIGSDIYRYDIASRETRQLTDTPESEYSPTVTPDASHFSVVRVEADGTQRLWRFDMAGKNPELVLADVKPVGYHAWIDAHTLALFVLGRPATLQMADVGSGRVEVIASEIGRSIQRTAGGVSFVKRETPAGASRPAFTICEVDAATRQVKSLVRAPEGADDPFIAWTPDGVLLLAYGGRLYARKREEPEMTATVDLASLGLRRASRLAVSPKGEWIAIVNQTQ